MYNAFVGGVKLNPLTASVPAFFAKSSVLWPAVLNLYVQKIETKNFLLKLLPTCLRNTLGINEIEPLTNSIQERTQNSGMQ